MTPKYEPLTEVDFDRAHPSSKKVYAGGANGVRVPMREITLSAGEPPLRVYDTSGPRGFDVHAGLPHTVRFVETVQPLIDHPLDVTRAHLLA